MLRWIPWKARASRIACGVLALGLLAACGRPVIPMRPDQQVVVLLHGLGRTDRSLRLLASRLIDAGYQPLGLRYPSRELDPEQLVALIDRRVRACCAQAGRVHFVTHSLGGVLIRAYLAEHSLPNLGRVVMLVPPNHGSEIVDSLGGSRVFRWLVGPTGAQLGTGPDSFPNRLPAPAFEFGVIAGSHSVNPLGSWLVPGDDDGMVSLQSTQLAGMADFVIVPASHAFIMRSGRAVDQILRFLRDGHFQHDAPL